VPFWLLPVTFPLVMALGGVLGVLHAPLPVPDLAIALSALLLGTVVATRARVTFATAAVVVGLFAIFHGHAHGIELPRAANPLAYGAGFVIATGMLQRWGEYRSVMKRTEVSAKSALPALCYRGSIYPVWLVSIWLGPEIGSKRHRCFCRVHPPASRQAVNSASFVMLKALPSAKTIGVCAPRKHSNFSLANSCVVPPGFTQTMRGGGAVARLTTAPARPVLARSRIRRDRWRAQ
jgi:hypothetical protein